MKKALVLILALLVAETLSAPRGRESLGVAISRTRIGGASEVGELIIFPLQAPHDGIRVGGTGLTNVGSMDFFDGVLWVASERDEELKFYTVDLTNAKTVHVSTFAHKFSDKVVSAGAFDDDGNYWVSDMRRKALYVIDPTTGELIEKISTPVTTNGIEIIGDTIYAVRGGSGDPAQEFGTIDGATGKFTLIGYTRVGKEGKGGGNGSGGLDFDYRTNTMYLVYRKGIEPGQRWSLYTVDLNSGAASFVGKISPERNYDAFAVVP